MFILHKLSTKGAAISKGQTYCTDFDEEGKHLGLPVPQALQDCKIARLHVDDFLQSPLFICVPLNPGALGVKGSTTGQFRHIAHIPQIAQIAQKAQKAKMAFLPFSQEKRSVGRITNR